MITHCETAVNIIKSNFIYELFAELFIFCANVTLVHKMRIYNLFLRVWLKQVNSLLAEMQRKHNKRTQN